MDGRVNAALHVAFYLCSKHELAGKLIRSETRRRAREEASLLPEDHEFADFRDGTFLLCCLCLVFLPIRLNSYETPTTLPPDTEKQCREFFDTAEGIHRIAGCDASERASFGSQVAHVAQWGEENAKLIDAAQFTDLELVSNSTSEHEVRYRPSDHRAVKRTWAGFYGQVPVMEDEALKRRNATPIEYLQRMALQVAVFASDLRLEGICISSEPSMIIGEPPEQPSFIVSQGWLEKAGDATPEAIAEFMQREGFVEMPHTYYGWFRPADGVAVVDAKPDNFIMTPGGLVALDLQIALFTAQEAAALGFGT